jgi:sec-independent protein translocase protein TatB
MRTVGQTIGKMRRMASEFQGQFMEAMREVEREADLESVKKEFQAINDQAKIDTSFDPVSMVRDDVTKAAAISASAAEAGAADPAKPEIGRSEIALSAPEPVVAAPPVDKEPAPEAPAAQRSAAE